MTAATLVCGDVRTTSGNKPFGPFGLQVDQFGPFQMTMLMPDLILAVGLEFERHGLKRIPSGRSEPKFDPNTLWRIPPDINVVPLPSPSRNIRPLDLRVLNKRRAGNRGHSRIGYRSGPPLSFTVRNRTSRLDSAAIRSEREGH